MGGAAGRYVRVMVSAQNVWGALEDVMADPPTSLGVAIDLANTRVHPDADRGDQRRLSEVGAEARPEVVIEVRASMEGASVQREPMSNRIEERNEKGKSDDTKHQEEGKANLPHAVRMTLVRARRRRATISLLSQGGSSRGRPRLSRCRRVDHRQSKSTGSPKGARAMSGNDSKRKNRR